MPASKRKPKPGVIGWLEEEPHRFRFVQLLNVLLCQLRRQGVSYDAAFGDVIRFRNSLSLSFAPSEVQAFEVERKAAGVEEVKKIRITPAFIGLLGAAGTLPLHDTERLAAQYFSDRDASQHELIDVFSNRMIGLFYEAWGKYRVEHGISVRGHDRLLPMLMALAGQRRSAPPSPRLHDVAAYYAGVLRTRPVSAASIERVLADYFGLPIRLEPFVGCWDQIPPNRRSTLALAPVLGKGATLGTRLWRHDLRARLHIGPLNESQLAQFLPGGGARTALTEMMALFAVPMLGYEVRLILSPSCVKRLTLTTKAEPRRLGWNSFLTGTPGVTRYPEIRSMLRIN